MQGGIVMTESLEDERNDLNNNEIHINRGFELMLRPRKRKDRKGNGQEVRHRSVGRRPLWKPKGTRDPFLGPEAIESM